METMANIFPYLVFAVYLVGCIFCLSIGRMGYLINGTILAIPTIIGSVAFMFIKRKDLDLSKKIEVFPYNISVSPRVFLLIYALTILAFSVTPEDSKWGQFMALILYVFIFIQILSTRLLPAIVLLEILPTLAVTIYSYTLRSALFFGGTDIMPHIYMSLVTYLSGHSIPFDLGDYTYFPLYHIVIALSSHLFGLDIQTSLFVVTCLVYTSTVLFLYYLVNGVFRNEQISLLIALTYAMNTDVIYYGTYMVTRTMAFVGFLLLLYLLYSLNNPNPERGYTLAGTTAKRVFIVIALIFVLLTHQVTTPMIIIILGLIFILELFVRGKRHVNLTFLAVPLSLFACYWGFLAYAFIGQLLPRAQPSLYQNIVFTDVTFQGWSFLVNQFDTLFTVFFAIVGAIYLIWKQHPKYSVLFGILGLFSVLLNVPNVLTVIFQIASILRIDRFALLFLPFLAVAMGIGIFVISQYLSVARASSRWMGVLLIALVVLYGIGSLGIIKEEPSYKQSSFDQDEIIGFNHVLRTVPSGSSLHSDYYTLRFFDIKKINASESLKLPYYTNRLIPEDLDISGETGYIIFQNRQFMQGGLLFGEEMLDEEEFDPGKDPHPFLYTEENVLNISNRFLTDNKVYSNRAIDVYYYLH